MDLRGVFIRFRCGEINVQTGVRKVNVFLLRNFLIFQEPDSDRETEECHGE